MYKYVALLVALLAFFASANAQHLGAHQSVSGVSAGVSGVSATSGKAGKGQHLLAGLEVLNAGLDDLAAKIQAMRDNLPEYTPTWKHKKNDVSGTSGTSGTSGVSGGNRKHGFGHA
jgi:hypothetical protein